MKTRTKKRSAPSAQPTRAPFFNPKGADRFFPRAPLRLQPAAGEPPTVRRRVAERPAVADAASAPPQVETAIESKRGGGGALADHIRVPMEQALGADLSGVQLHTDSRSDRLSRSLGARAFTTGRDVFFRHGEYKPDSVDGQKLLAHELTHVVQQSGPRGSARPTIDPPSDRHGGSLVDTLRSALAPQRKSAGRPDIQLSLKTDLRKMLGVYGPVWYEGVRDAIRRASVRQRRAAVVDRTVLDLIRDRLNPTYGSAIVSELLVGSQNWENPPASDFYNFFMVAGGSGSMPRSKTMNCWESIMYAAHLSGQLSATWIRNYYTSAGALPSTTVDPTPALWSQLGFSTSLPIYNPASGSSPTVGQLVFYLASGASVPSHVAVYVGNDEIISLWNQPNNITSIQRISITAISGTIHYANPPW